MKLLEYITSVASIVYDLNMYGMVVADPQLCEGHVGHEDV